MIRVIDAIMLAGTKLRTHKIRTGLTMISTILFLTILLTAWTVSKGIFDSTARFAQSGYGRRHLQTITKDPQIDVYSGINNPNPSGVLYSDLDKFAAKKYATRYNALRQKAIDNNFPEPEKPQQDPQAQSALVYFPIDRVDAAKEMAGSDTPISISNKIKERTNASQVYMSTPVLSEQWKISTYKKLDKTTQDILPAGVEDNVETPISTNIVDDEIIKPYIRQSNYSDLQSTGVLPVVVSMDLAEKIVGKKVNSSSSTEDQIKTIKTIKDSAIGSQFDICVSNTSLMELKESIKQVKISKERDSKNVNYTPPEVEYDVSPEFCSVPIIKNDIRSTEAKKAEQFTRSEVKGEQSPDSMAINLKIIGVSNRIDQTYDGFKLKNIFNVNSLGSISIPSSFATNSEKLKKIWGSNIESLEEKSYIAEYETLDGVKQAESKLTCAFLKTDGAFGNDEKVMIEQIQKCKDNNQVYYMQTFGTVLGQLDEYRSKTSSVITKISIFLGFIASIMIWSMVSKVVSEGRREMAVFRAVGAKRFDVAQIYLTYATLITTVALVIAVVVSGIFVSWLNARYANDILVQLVDLFSVDENIPKVGLYGMNVILIAKAVAVCLVVGCVGSALPVIGAVRRHPIKAMRDD